MKRSSPPSSRHRAGRRGVDGCAAAPGGGRPWRPRRLALMFAVAVMGWPSHNLARAACSNGLEGIESSGGDVCCVEACGMCGGEGCGNIEGLADSDCCTGDITDAGILCGDGNTAPCIIDGSTSTTPSPATETLTPQTAPIQDSTPTGSQPPTAGPTTAKPETGSQSPTTAPQTPTAPTASQSPTASPEPPVAPTPTGAPSGAAAPMTATSVPAVASVTTAPITMAPVVATSPPAVTVSPQAPSANQTCSNGFPGWQSNDACCSEFCGMCGGEGCGSLGSADCCYENIVNAGKVCGLDTPEAPCLIAGTIAPTPTPLGAGETLPPVAPTIPPAPTQTPGGANAPALVTMAPVSGGLPTTPPPAPVPTAVPGTSERATLMPVAPDGTLAPQAATSSPEQDANTPPAETEDEMCSNDLSGYQHGVVCCPLSCGQCGGSGCENIAGTEGASDCCSDVILAGGARCNATALVPVVAPCIVGTVDDVERSSEAANAATGLRRSGGIACAVAAAAATTAACFVH